MDVSGGSAAENGALRWGMEGVKDVPMFRPDYMDGGTAMDPPPVVVLDPTWVAFLWCLNGARWALLAFAAAVTFAAGMTGHLHAVPPPVVACSFTPLPGQVLIPPIEHVDTVKEGVFLDLKSLAVRLGLRDPRANIRPCSPGQ